MTDWSRWRACPVCRVELGRPCRSLSGRVVDGQPDGIVTELAEPHKARPARSARIVPDGFTSGLGLHP